MSTAITPSQPPVMDAMTEDKFKVLINLALTNPKPTTTVRFRNSPQLVGEWLKVLILGLEKAHGKPPGWAHGSRCPEYSYGFGLRHYQERVQFYTRFAKIVCAELYDTQPPTKPDSVTYEKFHWMIWKMIFNSVNVDIPIPEHDALRPYVPYFSSPEPRFSDEYKAYFGWRQSLEEGISSTHNPFNSPLSNAPSVTLNAPANPFVPLLIQAPATGQKRQASESPLTGNASPAKKECNQLADRELLNGETPLLELIELKASFKESRLQFFEAQTSGNNHDVNTKAVVLSPTAETQVQKLYLAEIKMTASEREQLGDSFTARIGAKDGSLIKVEVKICSST